MSRKIKQWTLHQRPDGLPTQSCFALQDLELPSLRDHQVRIETHFFSVDPGMRGRLSGDSYAAALPLGHVIESAGIGQIVETTSPRFAVGDMVMGGLGWSQGLVHGDRGLQKLDPSLFDDKVRMTAAIGVLGVPGLTAWFGLRDLGRPQNGETLLVSSAAGPVGATAGQLAKSMGLNVVGMAGGADKCAYVGDLGFDAVIDYKAEADLSQAISSACPDGVDIYFDNVGGEMLDAAIANMRQNGRIVVSGQIAEYNRATPQGIRNTTQFITHRLTMAGLVVYDYAAQFVEAQAEMATLIRAGSLIYKEDISQGIEQAPEAFIGLFGGQNHGRRLIQVVSG
jgi:NADPH-dependent curcumin reductase CurA